MKNKKGLTSKFNFGGMTIALFLALTMLLGGFAFLAQIGMLTNAKIQTQQSAQVKTDVSDNVEAATCTVSYSVNSGTSASSRTVTVGSNYGNAARSDLTFRSGYRFLGWSLLPSGYTQLSYVNSTKGSGTYSLQYFATSYYMNNSSIVEAKISSDETDSNGKSIAGATGSTSYEKFNLWYRGSDTKSGIAHGRNSKTGTAASGGAGSMVTVVVNSTSITVDGTSTSYTYSDSMTTLTQPLYIFDINNKGSANSKGFVGKLYYLTIREGTTMKMWLVPCKNSSNVYGFYDKVNSRFYPSATSTGFEGGSGEYVTEITKVVTYGNHTLYARWDNSTMIPVEARSNGSVSNTYVQDNSQTRLIFIGNHIEPVAGPGAYALADWCYKFQSWTTFEGTWGTAVSFGESAHTSGCYDTVQYNKISPGYEPIYANFTGNSYGMWEIYFNYAYGHNEYGTLSARTAYVSGNSDGTSVNVYWEDDLNIIKTGTFFENTACTATPNSGYSFYKWVTPFSEASGNQWRDFEAYFTTTSKTINFNANGGTVSTSSKSANYGSELGTLPTPTQSGYTFNGWYTAASGGTLVTAATILDRSLITAWNTNSKTFYAHWTPNAVLSKTWGTEWANATGLSVGTTINELRAEVNCTSIGTTCTLSNGTTTLSNCVDVSDSSTPGMVYVKISSGTVIFCTTASVVKLPADSRYIFSSGTGGTTNRFTTKYKLDLYNFSFEDVTNAAYMLHSLSYYWGEIVTPKALGNTSVALCQSGSYYYLQSSINDTRYSNLVALSSTERVYIGIGRTITLNGNGATTAGSPTSVVGVYGSWYLRTSTGTEVSSITNPTKDGYVFGGWASSSSGTDSTIVVTRGVRAHNSNTVSGYCGSGKMTMMENKTVYAYWIKPILSKTWAMASDFGSSSYRPTSIAVVTGCHDIQRMAGVSGSGVWIYTTANNYIATNTADVSYDSSTRITVAASYNNYVLTFYTTATKIWLPGDSQSIFGGGPRVALVDVTSADFSKFDSSDVTLANCMFVGLTSLKYIDLHTFDFSSLNTSYTQNMFDDGSCHPWEIVTPKALASGVQNFWIDDDYYRQDIADGQVYGTSGIPALSSSYPVTIAVYYDITLNKNGGNGGTNAVYGIYNSAILRNSDGTAATLTPPIKTNGNVCIGWTTSANSGSDILTATGRIKSGTVSGYIDGGVWKALEHKTLYAKWGSAPILSGTWNVGPQIAMTGSSSDLKQIKTSVSCQEAYWTHTTNGIAYYTVKTFDGYTVTGCRDVSDDDSPETVFANVSAYYFAGSQTGVKVTFYTMAPYICLPADSGAIFANGSGVTGVSPDLDSYFMALEEVDLTNFRLISNTNMEYMFYGCSSLTKVNFTYGDNFNGEYDVDDFTGMFEFCTALESVDLSGLRLPGTNWGGNYVFYRCDSLIEIVTPLEMGNGQPDLTGSYGNGTGRKFYRQDVADGNYYTSLPALSTTSSQVVIAVGTVIHLNKVESSASAPQPADILGVYRSTILRKTDNTSVSITNPTLSGYTFWGWAPSAGANYNTINVDGTLAGVYWSSAYDERTLYARWLETLAIPTRSSTKIYCAGGSTVTPTLNSYWNNYDSLKMTLSVNGQSLPGTYSGDNAAKFTLSDTSAYVWADGTQEVKSVSWTMSKAPVQLLAKGQYATTSGTKSYVEKTYDGTRTASVTVDEHFTVYYQASGTPVVTVTALYDVATVSAITVTITGTISNTTYWEFASGGNTCTVNGKINAATLNIAAWDGPAYNGTTTYSKDVTGLNSDSITVTYTLSSSYKNAGTYSKGDAVGSGKFTVAISGTKSGNYTIGTVGDLTIKAKSITIGDVSKTYTGATTYTESVNGVTGETVTVTYTLNSSYKGVGTYSKANSADSTHYSIAITSATSTTGNYTIGTAGTLTITAKAVTIAAKDQNITYGGTVGNGTSSVTLTGAVSGHVVTAVTITFEGKSGTTYTASTTKPTNAGSYSITPSSATIKVTDNNGADVTENYSITYTAGTLTIGKVDPTCTAPTANTNLKYTGSALDLITAGSATGGEMQYSLDGTSWGTAIPQGTNADDYTVYYKVVGDNNHNNIDADTVAVSITKAKLDTPASPSWATGASAGTAQWNAVSKIGSAGSIKYQVQLYKGDSAISQANGGLVETTSTSYDFSSVIRGSNGGSGVYKFTVKAIVVNNRDNVDDSSTTSKSAGQNAAKITVSRSNTTAITAATVATGTTYVFIAGQEAAALSATVLTGYTFEWQTEASGVTIGSATSKTTTVTATGSSDVTINATVTADTFSVVYNVNKPTQAFTNVASVPSTATATYDSSLTAGGIPTLTGFTFGGWYENTACTGTAISAGSTIAASTINSWYGSVNKNGTKNLYAKWTENTYSITFTNVFDSFTVKVASYDGSGVVSHTIANTNESTRTITGIKFTDIVVAGNVSVNKTKSGSTIAAITTSLPTRTGYSLGTYPYSISNMQASWYRWKSGSWTETTSTSSYGTTTLGWMAMRATSGTVTAAISWTANTYTVTLDKNHSDNNASYPWTAGTTQVTATYDSAMPNTFTTVPTRAGYTFAGYFDAQTNGTKYYNADKSSAHVWDKTSATTLYAHWSLVNYTVTYDANGGTAKDALTFNRESTSTLGTASGKTGYSFNNWKVTARAGNWTAVDSTYASSKSLSGMYGDITLQAQWTANEYTVTFDKNIPDYDAASFGTLSMADKQVVFGSEYGALATVTRKGFTFAGWYTASNGGNLVTAETIVSIADDHTLFAHWSANTYILTYELNGGTLTGVTNHEKVYLTRYTDEDLTAPTKNGYTFGGWKSRSNLNSGMNTANSLHSSMAVFDDIWTPGTAARIYAKWTANEYTVTLDKNHSDNNASYPWTAGTTEVTATYDSAMPNTFTTVPTRAGYTFAGYFDAQTNGTKYYNADKSSAHVWDKTSATTLYAHWTPINYTVTYDTDGGTAKDALTFNRESTSTLGTASGKTGYSFNNWKVTARAGNWTAVDSTYASSKSLSGMYGNVSLQAQWTANEYTISYDLAGGSVATNNPTSYTIESADITLVNPTKANYAFAGWTGTDLESATKTVTIAHGSTGNRSYVATWVSAKATVKIGNGDVLYFASINDAFEYANENAGTTSTTIKALVSHDITATLEVAQNHNYTVTANAGVTLTKDGDFTLFLLHHNTIFNIGLSTSDNNLTIDLNNCKGTFIYVESTKSSNVVINGGIYQANSGNVSTNNASNAIYFTDAGAGSLTINGGVFDGFNASSLMLTACTCTINGGTFQNNIVTEKLINYGTITINQASFVNNTFSTLIGNQVSRLTINDATFSGNTWSNHFITAASGKTANIVGGTFNDNLASGVTGKYFVKVESGGTANFGKSDDSTKFAQIGASTSASTRSVFRLLSNAGTANIYNVKYYGGIDGGIAISSTGTLSIKTATVDNLDPVPATNESFIINISGGTATIEGGTFTTGSNDHGHPITLTNSATVNISGGTFQGSFHNYIYSGTLNVSGTANFQNPLWVNNTSLVNGAVINISGGTFNSIGVQSSDTVKGTININGDFTLSNRINAINPANLIINVNTALSPTKPYNAIDSSNVANYLNVAPVVRYANDVTVDVRDTVNKTGGDFKICNDSYVQISGATLNTNLGVSTFEAKGLYIVGSYDVTFDANNGTVSPSSKSVTYGLTYGTLPTPTRDGYTFAGWWTENVGGTQVTDATTVAITANQTLYAHWTANEYTVTLDKNHSDNNASYPWTAGTTQVTATYDSAMPNTFTTVPTRTGYTFAGYFDAQTNGTKYYNADKSSAHVWDKTSATTLYAHWSLVNYTVTYDANGGTAKDALTFNRESTSTLGTASGKTGYSFNNWKVTAKAGNWTAVDSTYASSKSLSGMYGNVTLQAHWTANEYTITYATDGGTAISAKTYTIESTDTLPSATGKTGYTFSTWKVTTAGGSWTLNDTFDAGTSLTGKYGNVTLTAQWTPNKYKVTYQYNYPTYTYEAGTNSSTGYYADFSKSFGINMTINVAEASKRYLIIGNYTNTGDDGFNLELYSDNKFRVFCSIQGSILHNSVFGSWVPNQDITIAFTWNADTKTYTFAATGTNISGESTNTINTTYAYDRTLAFGGKDWRSTPDLNGNNMTIKSLTIYEYETYDSTYTSLDTPTSMSGEFVNWYASSNFAGNAVTSSTTITTASDHPLYAKWLNYYSVSFNPNGGYGTMADQSFTYGTAQNLTQNAYEKSGYDFAGWSTTLNGSKAYDDEQCVNNLTTTPNAVITLYAIWTAKTFTISFNSNGGSAVASRTETYGQTLTDLAIPTKAGYTFGGWYATFNGSNYIDLGRAYMFTNAFSAHFEAYMDDWTNFSNRKIVSCTQNGGWTINYGSGGVFKLQFTGTGALNLLSTVKCTDVSGWVTFDIIYNGTTIQFIVNGTSVQTNLASFAYNATNSMLLGAEVGATNVPDPSSSQYWTGKIGNVAINNNTTLITDAKQMFVVPAQNVTLYAKWTPVDYTITYVTGDGATGVEPVEYTIEDSITIALAPTHSTKIFTGWKVTTANGNWTLNDPYSAEQVLVAGKFGDVTLTAQWNDVYARVTVGGDATLFDSVKGAFDFSANKDVTIVLLKNDAAASNYSFTVASGKTVSVSGAFTAKVNITNAGGSITITNSTISGTYASTVASNLTVVVGQIGNVILSGGAIITATSGTVGTISATGSATEVRLGGTVTTGTITLTSSARIYVESALTNAFNVTLTTPSEYYYTASVSDIPYATFTSSNYAANKFVVTNNDIELMTVDYKLYVAGNVYSIAISVDYSSGCEANAMAFAVVTKDNVEIARVMLIAGNNGQGTHTITKLFPGTYSITAYASTNHGVSVSSSSVTVSGNPSVVGSSTITVGRTASNLFYNSTANTSSSLTQASVDNTKYGTNTVIPGGNTPTSVPQTKSATSLTSTTKVVAQQTNVEPVEVTTEPTLAQTEPSFVDLDAEPTTSADPVTGKSAPSVSIKSVNIAKGSVEPSDTESSEMTAGTYSFEDPYQIESTEDLVDKDQIMTGTSTSETGEDDDKMISEEVES